MEGRVLKGSNGSWSDVILLRKG